MQKVSLLFSKLKTTFSFETNRIQTDDAETTTNAVSIDKMSENVTLSSSSAMLSNENDGDVVIQDDLTEMLTIVPEDVREKIFETQEPVETFRNRFGSRTATGSEV